MSSAGSGSGGGIPTNPVKPPTPISGTGIKSNAVSGGVSTADVSAAPAAQTFDFPHKMVNVSSAESKQSATAPGTPASEEEDGVDVKLTRPHIVNSA